MNKIKIINTSEMSKKEIIIFLLNFLFIFEPKIFVKFPIINAFFVFGIVVCFLRLIYIYLKKDISLPLHFFRIVFFRLSFFVQTLLSKGDILMWGYFSIVLLTMSLLFHLYRFKIIDFLKVLSFFMLIILILNFLTILIFPNGITDELYFIGIRTRFTDVIFPAICISFVADYLNGKKCSIMTFLLILISFLTIVKMWIATAIVGLLLLIFIYFILMIFFKKSKISLVIPVLLALILNYFIVYGDLINSFSRFIEGVLHKSTSLSGRTEIWAIAKQIINKKPIFGYGMYDNGNFVYWGYKGGPYGLWQAHNQWLQMMFDGGILTTSIFICFILNSGYYIKQLDNKKVRSLMIATISIFLIMMITEIYSYTPYFYIILILPYELNCRTKKQCFEKKYTISLSI